MKTTGMITLTLALMALAAPGRAADDDPEPPPPIKVTNVKSDVKVKVTAGAGGALLVVEGTPANRTQMAQVELPAKNPPSKITFRFKDVDRLAVFALMGGKGAAKGDRALLRPTGQGKQTFHFGDNGTVLRDEKDARLSFTYAPGKDQVEVVMVRHKGKEWPNSPFRVIWGQSFGKVKKKG